MMRKQSQAYLIDDSIPEANKNGNCYQVAWDTLFDNFNLSSADDDPNGPLLVHGACVGNGPIEGINFIHAWVEINGNVIDNTVGAVLPIDVYYAMGNVGKTDKYTPRQAYEKAEQYMTYGPWESDFLDESRYAMKTADNADYKSCLEAYNALMRVFMMCEGSGETRRLVEEAMDLISQISKRVYSVEPVYAQKRQRLNRRKAADDSDIKIGDIVLANGVWPVMVDSISGDTLVGRRADGYGGWIPETESFDIKDIVVCPIAFEAQKKHIKKEKIMSHKKTNHTKKATYDGAMAISRITEELADMADELVETDISPEVYDRLTDIVGELDSAAHDTEYWNPVTASKAAKIRKRSGAAVYQTAFNLLNSVNDMGAAQRYLSEDNMAQHLKDDCGDSWCPRLATVSPDDIVALVWTLMSPSSGVITLTTNRELTPEELSGVSSWVSGQNSDGLGEGFEQQSFAYDDEEDDDGYFSNMSYASFDWKTNDYQFTKTSCMHNSKMKNEKARRISKRR